MRLGVSGRVHAPACFGKFMAGPPVAAGTAEPGSGDAPVQPCAGGLSVVREHATRINTNTSQQGPFMATGQSLYHRQHRLLIVSSDPSASVPTLLRQFPTPHRQFRPLIVNSDPSSSVPTLHRQFRLSSPLTAGEP